MVALVIYKLSKGEPILPQKEVNDLPKLVEAKTNPAFDLSDNL